MDRSFGDSTFKKWACPEQGKIRAVLTKSLKKFGIQELRNKMTFGSNDLPA
jgi:hypothetical protein